MESASVSWGTTQLADVTHLPGSFVLDVTTRELSVDGNIQDLPHRAYIWYGPAVATPPETPPGDVPPIDPIDPIGPIDDPVLDPGTDPPPAGQSFVYRGSDPITLVTLDVEGDEPLFDDATEAHVDLLGLPKEVLVTMLEDSRQAVVATKHGAVGRSTSSCARRAPATRRPPGLHRRATATPHPTGSGSTTSTTATTPRHT